jgi:hypothetical protein
MRNVGDWVDNNIRTIQISLGLCTKNITLKVRKFNPREGDELCRFWIDGSGHKRGKLLQPYALADIHETAESFKAYVNENAIDSMRSALAVKESGPLIRETYEWAFRHYASMSVRFHPSTTHPSPTPPTHVNYTLFFIPSSFIFRPFSFEPNKLYVTYRAMREIILRKPC